MWRDNSTAVGMGAMRLSSDPSRDTQRSLATLHAAFDAGLTLVDTADAYALDAGEVGHNERLIAQALDTWSGDRRRITVITKGGLTRPDGRWVPDGRARHLRHACDASRRALGVTEIALYQLHAPDPRVPFETSVRALASLHRGGAAGAVGVCNVTVQQIEAARAIVPVASVQVELSPWKDRAVASGVLEYCLAHDIAVLAYRPFGGVSGTRRVVADARLREIAEARGVTSFAVLLAWLRGLSPHILPLPGPTREETARDCIRAQTLVLSAAEQTDLDRYFPSGRFRTPVPLTTRSSRSSLRADDDVVMVMGLPGAGKTTMAMELVAKGYERLNRDETGGSLAMLVPRLNKLMEQGAGPVVLDNTYLSRAARRAVIDTARMHGRAVRGLWIDVSLEDAQVNVVWRMVRAHNRLLSSEELKAGRAPDRLAPSALFRAHREVEVPESSEGFASLEIVPFARNPQPESRNRAVIVWCDGVLRPPHAGSRPDEGDLGNPPFAARRSRLADYHADGWQLFALAWEPQVGERGVSPGQVESQHAALRGRLALDITFHYCPHGAGPPVCWCRKPLPGLGVLLAHHYQLDVSQCIYVGLSPTDASFARRMGFQYRHAEAFFESRTDRP